MPLCARGRYRGAQGGGAYARIDDWRRPAVRRGLWTATVRGAGAILLTGLVSVRLAARTP